MRVGLLGGSFNPPHQGHLYISNLAIKKLGLNQVWWIPTLRNPLKQDMAYEDYKSRISRCDEIIGTHPKISVKKFNEIYTEKLISHLQEKFPQIEFFWIMGADNLEKFHLWNNFKKISKKIPLIIFSREKFLKKIRKTKSWKFIQSGDFRIFSTKNFDLSSTKLRGASL